MDRRGSMPLYENTIQLTDIFTMQNFVIYLVIMNIIGFFIMLIDKKKAQKGKWRIPEKTLLLISLFGGSIGTLVGMYLFRHKTQKLRFVIGFPMILIFQVIIAIYLIVKY